MKLFQILVTSLFSISAFAQEANVFENIAVGFKITKPTEWQFVTGRENLDILKNVEMKDEESQQLMLEYSTAPLVAMMKYPKPFDDLNPSFKVNVKPFG